MMCVGAALAAAIEQLGAAGVPEPRPDAEVLLAHALGTSRAFFEELVTAVIGEIDEAVQAARRAPAPSPAELLDHVFA